MSIKPVVKFINCLYAYCSENNNLTFIGRGGGSSTPVNPPGFAIELKYPCCVECSTTFGVVYMYSLLVFEGKGECLN